MTGGAKTNILGLSLTFQHPTDPCCPSTSWQDAVWLACTMEHSHVKLLIVFVCLGALMQTWHQAQCIRSHAPISHTDSWLTPGWTRNGTSTAHYRDQVVTTTALLKFYMCNRCNWGVMSLCSLSFHWLLVTETWQQCIGDFFKFGKVKVTVTLQSMCLLIIQEILH